MVELAAGTLVTPSICLKRRLGAGGMGAVWVADHRALQTEVVVKFLADRLADNPTSMARFSREAAAAAQVKSPHVVQMLDHGVMDDGQPFIVMELLEGHDLAKELRRRKLSPEETAHVVEHVALALQRAHAKGIVHRDIKPNNIFLCDVGAALPFVKLLDFGIAREASQEQLTATGSLVGTPAFMSPEQLSGREVPAASDLWSLGIVAFKALTGVNPYERPTVQETMGAVVYGEPPVPTRFTPELPASIDAWFARACAKDPAQRFPSASDMAEGLWAALGVSKSVASSPLASSGPIAAAALPTVSILPTDPNTEGTLRSTVGSDSANIEGATAPPSRGLRFAVAAAIAAVIVIALVSFQLGSASHAEAAHRLRAGAAAVARAAHRLEVRLPPPAPKPAAELAPVPAKRAPKPAPPRRAPRAQEPSDPDDGLGF